MVAPDVERRACRINLGALGVVALQVFLAQAFHLLGAQGPGALGGVEIEARGMLGLHFNAAEHGAGVVVQHPRPGFLGAVVAQETVGAVFACEALGDVAGLPGGGLVAGALERLDVSVKVSANKGR